MQIALRRERPGDAGGVARVHRAAFAQPLEADLVAALHAAGAVRVALVALAGEEVVGHILFSPVTVESADPRLAAVALAPMAVLPEHQRRGIGSRLVMAGLEACRAAGHGAVVVLGHPQYYPRFGFVPASRFRLRSPVDAPDEAFMALELVPGALATAAGLVRFRPEFGAG